MKNMNGGEYVDVCSLVYYNDIINIVKTYLCRPPSLVREYPFGIDMHRVSIDILIQMFDHHSHRPSAEI